MRSARRTLVASAFLVNLARTLTRGTLATSLLLSLSGCGVATTQDEAVTEETLDGLVDAQVLENISQLESGLAGTGVKHEGRIWYSPDLVSTFLTASDGSAMAFTLGDARDYAALASPPAVGASATLWEVVEQQGAKPSRVVSSESGLDVILFDARPEIESGTGRVREALTGPDACPTTLFTQVTNPDNQLQYVGSVQTPSTFDSDRRSSITAGMHDVESSTIAVCSEVGRQRLVVTTFNPAWGTAPLGTGAGGLVIPQGHVGVWVGVGGWKQRRFCSREVWEVCLEHKQRILFQSFDADFTITPLDSGSEYRFRANFFRKADYVQNNECGRDCPVVRPGG